MEKRHKYNLWYVAGAFVVFAAFQVWLSYRPVATITYSDLLDYLDRGLVAEVSITESVIEGRYTTSQEGFDYFVTRRVDPEILKMFTDAGVRVEGASDENLFTVLISWVAPALILVEIWYFAFRGFAERGSLGGLTAELSRKLGDDGLRRAAYRGGCRACQNLSRRAIRHERDYQHCSPSSARRV